jgi:hypothetical protein
MSTPNRQRGELRRGEHRITVACDRCNFVSHTYPPRTLPEFWSTTLLGEILCDRCHERDLERA